jgi:hypothetical protein
MFWLDLFLYRFVPWLGLKKGIWYKIRDEKGNSIIGIAKLKKGEHKFKWRGKEYFTFGAPELAQIDMENSKDIETGVPTYESSVGLRLYEYFHDCPYPININPDAEHLVTMRERAATNQVVKANERAIAFTEAKLLFKKDEKQTQMLMYVVLIALAIIMLMLWNVMNKIPAAP